METPDPAVLFPAPFLVSNDGPLALNKIKASCILLHVRDAQHEFITDAATTNFIVDVPRMEAGEKATLPCVLPMPSANPYARSAEIIVVVNFRPDWVWKRDERRFVFYTAQRKDGGFLWYQQPNSAYPKITGHTSPFDK